MLKPNPCNSIFLLLAQEIFNCADTRTNRQKDKQTNRQTDGQTEGQTEGQTDGQTDKHPQSCSKNMPFGKPLKRLPRGKNKVRIQIRIRLLFTTFGSGSELGS